MFILQAKVCRKSMQHLEGQLRCPSTDSRSHLQPLTCMKLKFDAGLRKNLNSAVIRFLLKHLARPANRRLRIVFLIRNVCWMPLQIMIMVLHEMRLLEKYVLWNNIYTEMIRSIETSLIWKVALFLSVSLIGTYACETNRDNGPNRIYVHIYLKR